ncbi:MAG: ribonuclease R, partial [Burkholderiaceae bacterium]
VREQIRSVIASIAIAVTQNLQVSRVDLDARRIDLRLVHQPDIHTQIKKESRRADAEQVRSGLFGAKKSAKKATKKAAAAKPESVKARKIAKKAKAASGSSRAGRKKRK